MPAKIDSNITGTRFAVEQSLGVLGGSEVWKILEPNSFSDFGSEFKSVMRSPITAGRQKRKGSQVDEDASGGFEHDWVQNGLADFMPGFFFAAWRKKKNFAVSGITGTNTMAVTGNTGTGAVQAGDLVFCSGFTNSGNNGLKSVAAATSTTIEITGLTNETPPSSARVTKVGFTGGSGDIDVTVSGGIATLGSTTFDFTTLGLIPGEWIFIGGDASGHKFATAANNGFARVKTIAADAIELDRQPGTMVTDAGTGKTIRIFVGHVIKNEEDPSLIVRTSYQFERNFQNSLDLEYLVGAVPNELEFTIGTGEKVPVNMNFKALTTERASAKAGTRPAGTSEPAFTASNDFSRLRLLREDTAASLATYMDNVKLKISNNLTMNKAITVMGSFEVTAGDFEVTGDVNAYFASWDAVEAIKDNLDVSLDFAMVAENAGWLWDVPLITLGNGRLNVTKDQPIMLPLTTPGAMHETLQHTLLAQSFSYLPDAAE